MNRTRHLSATVDRAFGRRAGWLTLAAIAGIAMTFIAPALPADAGGRSMRRICAPTASSPAPATYTVAEGDAWFSVATAAGVTTGALLAANAADASTVLYPGDVLCLPDGAPRSAPTSDGASCASKHTVVNGDSWFRISRSADVSLESLLDANDANADAVLQLGAEICLPAGAAAPAPSGPACASKHTVLVGESWSGIAMSAGLRTTALLDANNATSTRILQPGDELCLPPGAAPISTANPCVSKRTVAAGESWYMISRSSGVPIEALYAANDASASSSLHPGHSLCLPAVGFGRGLRSTLLETAPVRGACRFANSWMASRGDRLHVGVDLISPAGTSVVAAASGTLTRQTKGAARFRERVVAHDAERHVLLLCAPLGVRERSHSRLAGARRRRHRLRRLHRQRRVTPSPLRNSPAWRQTDQPVRLHLDGGRLQLRPTLRAGAPLLIAPSSSRG